MKITRSTPISAVEPAKAPAQKSHTGQRSAATDTITLSSDAAFVHRARDAGGAEAPVRQDLVSEVKAQLKAGTFEGSVDMDKTLGSLLADL